MKSPFYFIVKPIKGRRYDNIKKIGGLDIVTSVSKEDYKSSNRFAEVIALPINYTGDIEVGNVLLVHHNVLKYYNDRSDSSVERSRSVYSIRSTIAPPWRRAKAQLKRPVRATPR